MIYLLTWGTARLESIFFVYELIVMNGGSSEAVRRRISGEVSGAKKFISPNSHWLSSRFIEHGIYGLGWNFGAESVPYAVKTELNVLATYLHCG